MQGNINKGWRVSCEMNRWKTNLSIRKASAKAQKPWRNAASLIIAAPSETSSNSPSCNYSLLYLKRASISSFFPNAYVYPGGAIDEADHSSKWLDLFLQHDPNFYEAVVKEFFAKNSDKHQSELFPGDVESLNRSVVPNEIAFRICAIRETFEESGLLLLTNDIKSRKQNPNEIHGQSIQFHLSTKEIGQWRKKVHENAIEFLNLCIRLQQVPDIWSLKEWSQWLTPHFPTSLKRKPMKRFDTVFYCCCLKEMPACLSHDEMEIAELVWKSPADMLKAFVAKEAFLAPPQILENLRLLNFNALEHLNRYICERALKGIECWVGCMVMTKDSVLLQLLPGDELYPEDFDATAEIKSLPVINQTFEELQKSPSKFRMIWAAHSMSPFSNFSCTAKLRFGQISPVVVSDTEQLNSRL